MKKDKEHTKIDKLFQTTRAEFEKVFETACSVSAEQHGFDADGRGSRASVIFTRQCVISSSLSVLLPKRLESSCPEEQNWDVCTLASITRNLVEGLLALYYFGTQEVSDLEADLRFQLFQLHRNIETYDFFGIRREEEDRESLGLIEKQKKIVLNHAHLIELTSAQKNKAKNFQEIYMTRGDFVSLLPVCENLKVEHRILSNLIHPSPLFLHRSNNANGRGNGSAGDISYSGICVSIAKAYLEDSVLRFFDVLPNHFSPRTSELVEELRVNVGKDIDTHSVGEQM